MEVKGTLKYRKVQRLSLIHILYLHTQNVSVMKIEKFKVLLYLKKSGMEDVYKRQDVPIHKSPRNSDHIGSEFRGQKYNKMLKPTWYVPGTLSLIHI